MMSTPGLVDGVAPRRHRTRTIGLTLLCVVLAIVLLLVGLALVLQQRLASHIHRIDGVFSGLEHRPSRPSGQPGDAVNLLVVGVDHSADSVTGSGMRAARWMPGARHVDSLMVLHFAGDRLTASSIAIPLQSWVTVPGQGSAEIGTVLSDDSPSLLVSTVEHLTDLRMDHLAVFDWAGYGTLTTASGGVELNVAATVRDPDRGITWPKGRYTVGSARAFEYVGQRSGLRDPLLGQTVRIQYFLRELMFDTLHTAMRKNPFAVYRDLDTVSRNLSVETGWSSGNMRNLAISMRNLRSAKIEYLIVPIERVADGGHPQAIRLDGSLDGGLWHAVRDDTVQAWLAAHPSSGIPQVVS